MSFQPALIFKKLTRGVFFLGVACPLAMVFACTNPTSSTPTAPAQITDVGWIGENIHTNFWSSPQSGHLFYDFWLNYSGSFSASDVKTARVYLPDGTHWTIDPTQYLNGTKKYLGGFGRWNNGPDDANALPLGTMKAVIEFNNGTATSREFTPHQPGTLGNGGHDFLTTTGSLNSYSSPVSAIPTPTVTNVVKNGTTSVTVTFSVIDSRVNNGFVWFYDSSNNYLGEFSTFRDKDTNALSAVFGGTLNVNGTNNVITIPAASLTPDSSTNVTTMMNSMSRAVVGVTDGAQYASLGAGHYTDIDYQSLSGKVSF